MRLSQVIAGLEVLEVRGPTELEISRVDYDSRAVRPGSLFCCVPGAVHDGHLFAAAAVAAGAVALLVERPVDPGSGGAVTQVRVPDVRRAMADAAAAHAGRPSWHLDVVGVTGTNGKTTTTQLLAAVLAAAGRSPAVLGTLSGARTTPEAPDLQRWLVDRRAEGVDSVAMEVSSHALALHRVDGTRFAVAVFTNLSRDHLDFHGSLEAYEQAKARLFTPELSERAVVNLDDPAGRRLAEATELPVVGYRLADLDEVEVGAAESRFRWRGRLVHLHLGGRFNLANALAAAEAARALGLPDEAVAAGLSAPVTVPGRFEPVDEGQPFRVVVDYAHTPDALEQVLRAAREVAGAGRVIVVFGCGGNRDATKRPVMGAVAARGADRVVLTADNSRDEDASAIIGAVREGYDRATPAPDRQLQVEVDRDRAIGAAIEAARPGDVVVIAGKGHETTQVQGGVVQPFDDRQVARAHLRRLGAAPEVGR